MKIFLLPKAITLHIHSLPCGCESSSLLIVVPRADLPPYLITSVHSRFRDIGKSLLFKFAKPLTASNFRARLATAPTVGGLIRRISINIKDLDPSLDALFSTIVENLKQLEDLTLIYDKDDKHARPALTKSLCTLGYMSKLRVEEADIDMTKVPCHDEADRSHHFVDYVLNSLLSSGSIHIQSLAHISSSSLHSSVFHTLRTQPTQLRTLMLRSSIQDGLRGAFNEPTQWSSAAALEKLIIRSCSGTHYATIARHVVSGVFGHLKHLIIVGSGYLDESLLAVRRPGRSIRALDLLEIDHAFDWEVLALAIIPAKEVHVTRVFRHAIVSALTQGGFPGLEVLKVQHWNDEAERLFPEFRKACADLDVQLRVGAIPYGRCTCHDERVAGTRM